MLFCGSHGLAPTTKNEKVADAGGSAFILHPSSFILIFTGGHELLATLGSISMGLVWGWLLVHVGGRGQRPWRSLLLLGPATLLAAAQHFFLAGWQSLLFFLAATALSFLLYSSWRRSLRRSLRQAIS